MKTLIIAEAGVNHNGDLAMARELVAQAAAAGADYVKFQTFITAENITTQAPKASYQMATTDKAENQYDMVARLELNAAAFSELKDVCRQHGIGFLSTAFDIPSAHLLNSLAVDYIKIPSGDLTNLPLLRCQAQFKRPFLISTGMADLAEIAASLELLYACGTRPRDITLLHCTTEYPAPYNGLNLRALTTLADTFGTAVGYSDHSLGIEVPIAAVALGARVIEKHFTLDCGLPGPDHRASLEPAAMKAMVNAIRHTELALGQRDKKASPCETGNRAIARKSLVARVDIAEGDIFSEHNLAVKRPGTGISPMRWDEVLGQPARRAFAADEMIEL